MDNPEQNQPPQPASGETYPQAPSTGEQKQQNNRKKWFWGCGGCLVVLLLIAGVVGMLSVTFFNKLQEGSADATRAIFGDNPPAGYLALGLQLPKSTGLNNLVLLMNQNNQQQMLFAFDGPMTPEQAALLKQGHPSEESLKKLLQEGLQGSPSQGSNVSVDKLRIDKLEMASLPANGGKYPVVSARIEDDGTYIPAVVGLLPHPNNRLVGLVGLDIVTKGTDPAADFSTSYQSLQSVVQGIIIETDLDETAELK